MDRDGGCMYQLPGNAGRWVVHDGGTKERRRFNMRDQLEAKSGSRGKMHGRKPEDGGN